MRYDQQAIQNSQRSAFELLLSEFTVHTDAAGNVLKTPSKFMVDPINVTAPAHLVQELPWTNATNTLTFDFSLNAQAAPAPVVAGGLISNNVILGKTNVAVIYGLQILQGEGVNPASRIYRSFGITQNDNALYNSTINFKFNTSVLVDKMNGQNFRDVAGSPLEFDQNSGMCLWQPLRIVTGEIGVFQGVIQILNTINGLVLSPNVVIAMRPLIVFGQAGPVGKN